MSETDQEIEQNYKDEEIKNAVLDCIGINDETSLEAFGNEATVNNSHELHGGLKALLIAAIANKGSPEQRGHDRALGEMVRELGYEYIKESLENS
jgi:hypothetical protein